MRTFKIRTGAEGYSVREITVKCTFHYEPSEFLGETVDVVIFDTFEISDLKTLAKDFINEGLGVTEAEDCILEHMKSLIRENLFYALQGKQHVRMGIVREIKEAA